MRVRIIASKPMEGEEDISHLIGQEFKAKKIFESGTAHIGYGGTEYFALNPGEYEVVEQKEAPGAVTP